jgi:enamine deaminase RidA (YjgF/YER057c/UK114 family)
MNFEKKLQELGYTLPEAPKRVGAYMPIKEFCNNLLYVSGCLPIINGENITGKLGADCSIEDGCKAAERCVLNILALLKAHLGDLDKIKSCVKMTVFVASTPEFTQHPQVANAATELLIKVMGEEVGCPSRAAMGVAALPLNVAVEIEMMVETL